VINFRTKNDTIASLIGIFAVLILIGTTVWMYLPLPNQKGITQNRNKQLAQLNQQIESSQKSSADAQKAIDPFLWTGKSEQVGPAALDTVTKLAKNAKLKLLAFRPQKPDDEPGVTLYTFGVTVDGPYTNAMQLVKDLENPKNKLAVTWVQINSADAATDRVTGTINVVAYMKSGQPQDAQGGNDVHKS
jgi:hypothetical protein